MNEPNDALDYAVYGRQIALPELGAHGQRALARVAVRFVGEPAVAAIAASLHVRAGGRVDPDAGLAVALPARAAHWDDAAQLGLAAWAAVEAARRALGLGEACDAPPEALLERLAGAGGAAR